MSWFFAFLGSSRSSFLFLDIVGLKRTRCTCFRHRAGTFTLARRRSPHAAFVAFPHGFIHDKLRMFRNGVRLEIGQTLASRKWALCFGRAIRLRAESRRLHSWIHWSRVPHALGLLLLRRRRCLSWLLCQ